MCAVCGLGDSSYCPENRGERCLDKYLPLQCATCEKVQACVAANKTRRKKCKKKKAEVSTPAGARRSEGGKIRSFFESHIG